MFSPWMLFSENMEFKYNSLKNGLEFLRISRGLKQLNKNGYSDRWIFR